MPAHIKTFGYVLTDPVQRGRTAGACAVHHVDYALDPRQVCRQGTAVRAALPEAHHTLGWRLLFRRSLVGGLGLFCLLQAELQLVGRQALGAAAEAVTLEFTDDLAQTLVLDPLGRQTVTSMACRVTGSSETEGSVGFTPMIRAHPKRAGDNQDGRRPVGLSLPRPAPR